ncbi:uncharacterized protein LOC122069600 [Macadamia integrifolia]|uniref:uncharacterized protein LOC122069600 n=1 Tax=Macadamia integrifolia TaxID=60698 RepID=UPI001C4F1A8E|nr:uncharacterized protein LOC122069600 [Macadamia integrifolia]
MSTNPEATSIVGNPWSVMSCEAFVVPGHDTGGKRWWWYLGLTDTIATHVNTGGCASSSEQITEACGFSKFLVCLLKKKRNRVVRWSMPCFTLRVQRLEAISSKYMLPGIDFWVILCTLIA